MCRPLTPKVSLRYIASQSVLLRPRAGNPHAALDLHAGSEGRSSAARQKLEQLKQIADEVDAKITPLLDQQQQQKFQAIREEHRRELIEKLGGKMMQKLETMSWFATSD